MLKRGDAYAVIVSFAEIFELMKQRLSGVKKPRKYRNVTELFARLIIAKAAISYRR